MMPTRYDIFLIVGLLILASLGIAVMRYTQGGVDIVVVQVDGEEVIKASLSGDQYFSVDGELGQTQIEIKNERVRITDSPCKRKTCVHTGWIHRGYQTIVCMPNHVMIRLTGSRDDEEIDGITR